MFGLRLLALRDLALLLGAGDLEAVLLPLVPLFVGVVGVVDPKFWTECASGAVALRGDGDLEDRFVVLWPRFFKKFVNARRPRLLVLVPLLASDRGGGTSLL